jgi:hypothetical protein
MSVSHYSPFNIVLHPTGLEFSLTQWRKPQSHKYGTLQTNILLWGEKGEHKTLKVLGNRNKYKAATVI